MTGRPRKYEFSDPVFAPDETDPVPLLQELEKNGWPPGRVAASLLTHVNTIKRWLNRTAKPTYGYMQALIRLHAHVCKPEQLLTKQSQPGAINGAK